MTIFKELVEGIHGIVWGWPMILLLLGTHLYMTLRTGVIQKYIHDIDRKDESQIPVISS